MRRLVEILDWGATAIGAMMAINLGVVALILAFHVDDAPRYRDDLPLIMTCALLFGLLGTAACAAAIGMRRDRAWGWAAQGGVLLAVGLVAKFVADFLAT